MEFGSAYTGADKVLPAPISNNYQNTKEDDTQQKTSAVKATVETIQGLMQSASISVRLNEISGQLEVYGLPKEYSRTNAANTIAPYLYDAARHMEIKASRALIADAILLTSDINRYNPVKDMLTKLPWDKQLRFITICETLHITPGSFDSILLRKWMHQTIALALNDEIEPYGADGVLVLQGPQGIGKTRFFVLLSCHPAWFAEGVSINTDKIDTIIQSTGVWIAELGELDSTLKREQAALKAFLTSSSDTYRVPYAKVSTSQPRRTSFCATVNPASFLNDSTGSRRFWVIHVDEIDLDRLHSFDRQWFYQLWREIYTIDYLDSPQGFRLTGDERKMLEGRNRQYDKPLPFEMDIMEALNWDTAVNEWNWKATRDIKNTLYLNSASSEQVGRALKKIADNDDRVQVKNIHNVKHFLLPPKKPLNL